MSALILVSTISVFAGVLALGIALLMVSFQSWKADITIPVEAIRHELG